MTSAELPSSLTSPPSAPRLPAELLAQIVDEAAGPPHKLDYTTLRHLCLASKNILPFARSALYRDLSLSFNNRLELPEERVGIFDGLEAERFRITCDGEALVATIARTPHLALLVTRLTLIYQCEEGAIQLPIALLNPLFESCINITSFRSLNTWWDEAEGVIDELTEAELELEELEASLTANIPFLSTCHLTLKRLTLHNDDPALNVHEVLAPTFPFELASLQVADRDMQIPHALLEQLFCCSESSLRTLDLAISAATEASSLLPQLSALSNLTLRLSSTEALPNQLVEALAKCASLRSLRLFGALVFSSELPRLPPQLSTLHFEEPVGTVDVAHLISDGSRSALRRVTLEQAGDVGWQELGEKHGGDVGWQELGEKHGWSVERCGKKVVFARWRHDDTIAYCNILCFRTNGEEQCSKRGAKGSSRHFAELDSRALPQPQDV
ncbi:hypothetical protein BCR35DRAFT_100976 [Leucosporidium creatinivorum]|uniref:F-box domain-containing protein n=1 Tax=Leucosporidium creatinivorum TaxID=106004 RepID=A0A1Y2F3B2_9BASI|nr:hypothetical protein BCR35DRAFT_100976 [Leucosporidium creatinivorum]